MEAKVLKPYRVMVSYDCLFYICRVSMVTLFLFARFKTLSSYGLCCDLLCLQDVSVVGSIFLSDLLLQSK